MVEYYEEAEEYLEHISDDIPLFTNTREGVYSEGTRTAPAPLESNSDLFVSPLRAQLEKRRAERKAPTMPAPGGVAARLARFQGGSVPPQPGQHHSSRNGRSTLDGISMEAAAAIEIPGLQDGIADLQMTDSDDDNDIDDAGDEAEAFDDIPEAPSRSKETSPMMNPKSSPASMKLNGSPASDQSPGLPDKMMRELELSNSESCDVSPHVIQGLVQIMRDGSHEKRKKATIAMCNLCCESQQNRTYSGDAGAVPVLIAMMHDSNPDIHLQRLATACICNLSADPPLKDAIAQGGAIPHLSRLLQSDEDSGELHNMWDVLKPQTYIDVPVNISEYLHVQICMRARAYTHTHTRTHTHTHTPTCLSSHLSIYIHTYTYTFFLFLRICICMYACVYNRYIYIYIYTYMYVFIYIYICICMCTCIFSHVSVLN